MSSLKDHLTVLLQLLPLELRYEIEENNQRKSYTFTEIAEMQEKLSKIFKQKFPVGKKGNGKEMCQNVGTLADAGIKRVDDVIGKAFKESGETVRKRRVIHNAVKKDPKKYEKIVEKIDGGHMSIDYAERMIRQEELKLKPTPPLPEGIYDLIYLDPPWKYDLELSGAPPYKTMIDDEIKKLKLPMAKDCIVFMWVTNPKLNVAMDALKEWGLTYKTNMAWVKMKNGKLQTGTGHHVFGAHELLLKATRGHPRAPATDDIPASVVIAERTKTHSEKPKIFYDIIEKAHPKSKKLEMFARVPKDQRREGWTYWGDEAD